MYLLPWSLKCLLGFAWVECGWETVTQKYSTIWWRVFHGDVYHGVESVKKKSPKKRQIPVNWITCYHMWVLHKIHDKHSWNLEVSSENPEITGTQDIHAEPTNFPLSPRNQKKRMTGQRPSREKRSQMIFVYTPQIRDGCPQMIEPPWKCIETAIFGMAAFVVWIRRQISGE